MHRASRLPLSPTLSPEYRGEGAAGGRFNTTRISARASPPGWPRRAEARPTLSRPGRLHSPAMPEPYNAASATATAIAPHPPIDGFYQRADEKRAFLRHAFDGAAGDYDRV